MKTCPKCNSTHNKAGKFCSRSCANSRGPRTDDFKNKVSKKLKGNIPHNKGVKTAKRIIKKCLYCDNKFQVIQHKNERKYCSLECSRKNPNLGGYRKGSGRSKSGYYKNIYCGSTYELAWVIYNIDHKIKFEEFKNQIEFNGEIYFPDFLQNKRIKEIKGFKSDNVDKQIRVAEGNGYKIDVLYKKDIQYCLDYVIEKYKTKNLYELYD